MKSFLVIGLGAFGESVAKTLYSQGQTVVGVDLNRERVERAREYTSEVIEADVSDQETMEQVMEAVGIENIETVVVGVGRRLDASVLTCLFLKEMGVDRIVAKVLTHEHARVLRRLGVYKSLFPEADSGERLARRLINPNVEDLMDVGGDVKIFEIPAPEAFVDTSLGKLQLRAKYNLLVVAIRKETSENVEVIPGAESIIKKGDRLVLLGSIEDVDKLPE